MDVVFDFGGWVDERIGTISEQFDAVVVVISFQSKAELHPCINMVGTLNKYNKNVIILINNTKTKIIPRVKKSLQNRFPENKIFTIKQSDFIHWLPNEGKTTKEIAEENPLFRYNLKELNKQIDEFHNYLDKL
ncbi:MAG: hypothetical protein D3903_21255 [Candidatus Electrothrix sp. GM3_4]|nr:hypothetical protein [Candidatus Electrothrix sp. GM3_4]